jgi:hypothetical protein
MKRQTRREFVGAAASLVALALVPGTDASEPKRRDRLLVSQLVNLVTDPSAADVFGRRYLEMKPDEAKTAKLVELICGEDRSEFENQPPSKRLALLRARYHVDFKKGDVVDLFGWQLARTECRLYALATLA